MDKQFDHGSKHHGIPDEILDGIFSEKTRGRISRKKILNVHVHQILQNSLERKNQVKCLTSWGKNQIKFLLCVLIRTCIHVTYDLFFNLLILLQK